MAIVRDAETDRLGDQMHPSFASAKSAVNQFEKEARS